MNPEKNHITISDLLEGDGFLAWYLKTNHPRVHAWDRWVYANKTNAGLAKKAACLLSFFLMPDTADLWARELAEAFGRIHEKINQ